MLYIVLWRSSPAQSWNTVGRAFDALSAANELYASFCSLGYQSHIVRVDEGAFALRIVDAQVSAA